ncbi:MAG TPA: peptidoglycan-binding protein [Nitrosomonas sp.]|nr:peptidoglycan-binding protein [Nitrosomonas sp.]
MVQFTNLIKNDPRFIHLVEFLPGALEDFYSDDNKLQLFLEHSSLTKEEAERLLTHSDSEPYVDIKNLDSMVWGQFDPDLSKRITLNAKLALRFNQDYENKVAWEFILATVLHECVHYGRKKNNLIPSSQFEEHGKDFELAAWGKLHEVPWFDDVRVVGIPERDSINIGAGIIAAAPDAPSSVAAAFENIKNDMTPFKILDNKNRLAHLIGQCAHESGNFLRVRENLFYTTPERLIEVFPSHFRDLTHAQQYLRNPEKLANYVYAKRNGNGSEVSGDGFLFRGRGYIQLTGRSNYKDCGDRLGIDFIANPEKAEEPEAAWRIAVDYLVHRKKDGKTAFEWADTNNYEVVTRIINPALEGLNDRRMKTIKALMGLNGFHYPRLEIGDEGESVSLLQEKLASKSFSPGTIDGNFSLDTDNAVRAFQKANSLKVDGIVADETWAALNT